MIFEVKQKLIAQAGTIAEMLLPQGQRRANHWIVGNPHGFYLSPHFNVTLQRQ
ncbi:hypothetical protein HNQ69_001507 [Bartonella callosciuri]|uniref:Uncharacterized protein n=1 Tax=Bartonella callosciuri TaxID=686223 RepID=A0A840NYP3_9HYPH|nr:hypothetical protein [Bartonella callosciuri]MBB5074369.1 hypothetical protein [Bartonella callosciuri]